MLGINANVDQYLRRFTQEILRVDSAQIKRLADLIFTCYEHRRFVFIVGNGGSASNASHLCEDLGKGSLTRKDFETEKPRLRVLSLTDCTPYITAWGNDEGYDCIFAEQLKNLAGPGDLLVAISGSGNSANILRAVAWANSHGLTTFGCTGFDGGKLRTLANHHFHVPLDDMGMVESIHLAAFHWIVDDMHRRIGIESPVLAQPRQNAA